MAECGGKITVGGQSRYTLQTIKNEKMGLSHGVTTGPDA